MIKFANKVYWMDDSDPALMQGKLAAIKDKYADCDWTRFCDDSYSSGGEAYKSLVSTIRTAPVFSSGKIVYCFGMPLKKWAGDYHQSLAKEFAKIPDGVCLVIIARPDRGSSIWKAAKAYGTAEEPFDLTKENAIEWITQRAAGLKLSIDRQACKVLADLTDFNPAKIQNELIKLKFAADDGVASQRLISMIVFADGHTDVRDLGNCILAGDGHTAHEYMQRLLDRGEPPIKICGYLQDWINRLAISASYGCDYESMRMRIVGLKKWQVDDSGNDGKKYETIDDERWGRFSRRCGETVPMFAKEVAFRYSCEDLAKSGKGIDWAYKGLQKMYDLQLRLRRADADETKAMHEFISEMIEQ